VRCPFCAKLNRVAVGRAADRPACGECGKPILLDRPLAATDDVFDRIVRDSQVPLLVDFYADWCGPCHVMAPVLDQVARERMGQALVLKLDTDRNPQTSRKFSIRGIPTLIAFRGGREIGRETGAVPKQRIEALLALAENAPAGDTDSSSA
jgi:thioredoxin 2